MDTAFTAQVCVKTGFMQDVGPSCVANLLFPILGTICNKQYTAEYSPNFLLVKRSVI